MLVFPYHFDHFEDEEIYVAQHNHTHSADRALNIGRVINPRHTNLVRDQVCRDGEKKLGHTSTLSCCLLRCISHFDDDCTELMLRLCPYTSVPIAPLSRHDPGDLLSRMQQPKANLHSFVTQLFKSHKSTLHVVPESIQGPGHKR